ncbi:hypothetical protein, partial [Mycolicibacillus koreensis]|uniref:hypothetical protein n=2 Tax=Mycolicibacillus koreensis TaxID=1069220 RepID=UPI0021F3AE1D
AGHTDNVVAELTGIGPCHGDILPARPSWASQLRCHLIVQQTPESWMGMFAESPCAIRDESVFVDDAHIITADRIQFGPRE